MRERETRGNSLVAIDLILFGQIKYLDCLLLCFFKFCFSVSFSLAGSVLKIAKEKGGRLRSDQTRMSNSSFDTNFKNSFFLVK